MKHIESTLSGSLVKRQTKRHCNAGFHRDGCVVSCPSRHLWKFKNVVLHVVGYSSGWKSQHCIHSRKGIRQGPRSNSSHQLQSSMLLPSLKFRRVGLPSFPPPNRSNKFFIDMTQHTTLPVLETCQLLVAHQVSRWMEAHLMRVNPILVSRDFIFPKIHWLGLFRFDRHTSDRVKYLRRKEVLATLL